MHVTDAEAASSSLRRRACRRSPALVISGITARTGSASVVMTSSSLLKLVSRYSRNATSPRPNARPPRIPNMLMRSRSGLTGRSGSRAPSMTLNCSPIWRRSRLTAIFESSLFLSSAV